MAKRVKTNYDRGYVNAMDKIRVFIESSSKVMYVDKGTLESFFKRRQRTFFLHDSR